MSVVRKRSVLMTRFTRRTAALLASSLVVVFVTACGSGSDPKPTESTASGSVAATSAAAAPSDSLLTEGTYRTPELTRKQLIAAGKKAGLTQAQAEQALAWDGIDHTAAFAVKLAGGHFTQFESNDGGAEGIGSRGTYQVLDDGTVVTTEECCGETTYQYALDGDAVRINFKDTNPQQLCQNAVDCWMGFIVWESAPFVRV
jgi:hypothetical protein